MQKSGLQLQVWSKPKGISYTVHNNAYMDSLHK